MKFQDIPIGGKFRLNPEGAVYTRSGENEWYDPSQDSTHHWIHPTHLEEVKKNPAFAGDQRVFPETLTPVTVTFPCIEVAQMAAKAVSRGMTGNTCQSHGEVLHFYAVRSFKTIPMED